MNILCDVDGVIVDLLREWLDAYDDAGGEFLVPAEITEYDWENFVANKPLFLKLLKSAGIFAAAKPLPGALEGLRRLRERHDVTLVTTVFGTRATDAKIGWLFRYVKPTIRTEDVIFCRRKELISGDVLIEDSPKNLEKWLAAHPAGRGLLIDQPYNQAYRHERCTRVFDLDDAADMLCR